MAAMVLFGYLARASAYRSLVSSVFIAKLCVYVCGFGKGRAGGGGMGEKL